MPHDQVAWRQDRDMGLTGTKTTPQKHCFCSRCDFGRCVEKGSQKAWLTLKSDSNGLRSSRASLLLQCLSNIVLGLLAKNCGVDFAKAFSPVKITHRRTTASCPNPTISKKTVYL